MMNMYTEKDLIEFGSYVLSLSREDRVRRSHKNDPPDVVDLMIRSIHHADIANWQDAKKIDDTKDIELFDRLMNMENEN